MPGVDKMVEAAGGATLCCFSGIQERNGQQLKEGARWAPRKGSMSAGPGGVGGRQPGGGMDGDARRGGRLSTDMYSRYSSHRQQS